MQPSLHVMIPHTCGRRRVPYLHQPAASALLVIDSEIHLIISLIGSKVVNQTTYSALNGGLKIENSYQMMTILNVVEPVTLTHALNDHVF